MRQERHATFADIPRLMEIRAAVRENRLSDPLSVTRTDYERFIGAGRVWVCEIDGRIAGFSAGHERDGTIWALFVDPGYEGRGIGTSLLHRACNDLSRDGHLIIRLSTGAGTRAERLYRRLGWAETGIEPEGEVRFEKMQ